MRILGLESSCDETAAAIVDEGVYLLSNAVASQVEIHTRYGGIVPEVASRQHLLTFLPVIRQAMEEARVGWDGIDAVGVTMGPGLAGSLLVGVSLAKALALARALAFVGINHLEGHIYANWLECQASGKPFPEFPCLCLIASGGHTDLLLMRGHGQYRLLGRTRDDAAGEAFDKAARILGLGFPGGPLIDKLAVQSQSPLPLPRARLKEGSDDFSFSGLKTAMLHAAERRGLGDKEQGTGDKGQAERADLAAGFQEAVVDMLATRTIEVAQREGVKTVLLGGGVVANSRLREAMAQRSPIPILFPRPGLCTDNAAMIASCAYFRIRAGDRHGLDLDAVPNLRLG